MIHSPDTARVMREDLRAQLAPLNRYGMVESIAGAVSGLRALARALGHALCRALGGEPCGCEG